MKTMFKTLDEVKAFSLENGEVVFVVWNGYAYELRAIPERGFGGALVGKELAVKMLLHRRPNLQIDLVCYTS